MSTRASVKVYDDRNALYFYQHCDGYPRGLGATLKGFLETAQAKSCKDDLEYLCGYMLLHINDKGSSINVVPAVGVHGDEDYQYAINAKTLDMETIRL